MSVSTRISPKYSVEHWRALTLKTESDWEKAIEIFEDRIRGRFLDIIRGFEQRPFAGFAVLALDCLLIETLQQFREGKSSTPKRMGETYFVRFLTQTCFKSHFDASKAAMFYRQFRNGILHQAEVKGPSLVRRDTPNIVDLAKNGKGLILNRRLFHEKLVQAFEEYIDAVRTDRNGSLRSRFQKKMNLICSAGETE